MIMLKRAWGGADGQADVQLLMGLLYKTTICHGELQDKVGKQDTILISVLVHAQFLHSEAVEEQKRASEEISVFF